jgi:hypothetical protein
MQPTFMRIHDIRQMLLVTTCGPRTEHDSIGTKLRRMHGRILGRQPVRRAADAIVTAGGAAAVDAAWLGMSQAQ